ncbi:MAG: FumA C-terminus/TtdB family hydratase beta subunit [Fibromonadaceae bacterium]|jgi:fumarate hydratase class I|nr:FumA C-terminus/TtdB family hydratase beta subunit [Fibromonadaceae bacterium]
MAFEYEENLQYGKDATEYNLVAKASEAGISVAEFEGKKILKVSREALVKMAEAAYSEVSFRLRPAHTKQVATILGDKEASQNDKLVALTMLQNSVVSNEGILPFCQDTGTAIVFAKKGQNVWTGCNDTEAITEGVFNAYNKLNLRYSQIAPLNMYDETNTGNNLPAQIDIHATEGDSFDFLFIAKGGGSANKTLYWPMTKALLTPAGLEKFLKEQIKNLGTAACPPYHLAVVIGGTSADANLKLVKLASTGYLDNLPTTGNKSGRIFRDLEMEAKVLELAQKSGIGAQFGGKYLVHDVRVIRAPRHAASCPVGLGVSCSADRNIKARITAEGLFLEKMEGNPQQYLPKDGYESLGLAQPVSINIDRPIKEVLAELSKYPVKTPLYLNGTMIVARDIAHAELAELLAKEGDLPEYFKNHPVYYAGPAKTPPGKPTGSFGPTTAGRMDSYVASFQEKGASLIMVAKGNRTKEVTTSCKKNGGFYLGSIGGPAALLAEQNILSNEVLAFPELGMEAIRKITVKDFPAFIIVDDKGNDFFEELI